MAIGTMYASGDGVERSQEMARSWIALREAGAPVECVDVGGGLGVDYEGTPLCCQPLFHGLFRVHVAKHKPKQAAVCVKYRDHWFYIADDDPDSKLTLFLLGEIVSLQVQLGGAENLPVLTLGVGS